MVFKDIFSPVEDDYALSLLRRVLGCTVDALWKGGECGPAGELIAGIATIANFAMLIITGILVTYTLWVGVANTARTGEPGGDISTGWTVARIGLGVIALAPVANGFSIAQVLVIQLLVWGSGFGDAVWSRAASLIQSGGYTATAQAPSASMSAAQRGEFAQALYARTAGYACAMQLNKLQQTLGDSGDQIQVVAGRKSSGGWFNSADTYQYAFTSGRYFNSLGSLCGSVSYTLTPAGEPENLTDIDRVTYSSIASLIDGAVAGSVASAMGLIDQQAHALASSLITQPFDAASFQQQFNEAVRQAAGAFAAGMKNLPTSQLQNIKTAYLTTSVEQGWAMAPMWQRSSVNIANKIEAVRRGVTLNVILPEPADTLFLRYYSNPSTISQTILEEYERSLNHLQTQAGFVAAFASEGNAGIGRHNAMADDSGIIAAAMRGVLSAISLDSDTSKFVDPFSEMQRTGAALAYAAAGAKAGGLALDLLPATRVASAVTGAGGWVGWIGGVLAVFAVVLGGILPLVPIAFFLAAFLGWLIHAVEAMFAVVLIPLNMFVGVRRGGRPTEGLEDAGRLALTLLLQPALIVIALVASLLLAGAGILIVNAFTQSIMTIMIPLDGSPSETGLLGLGAIAFYILAALLLVLHTSSIITEFPNLVLRYVGAGADRHGERIGGAMVAAAAPVAIVGRAAGRLPMQRSGPAITPPVQPYK